MYDGLLRNYKEIEEEARRLVVTREMAPFGPIDELAEFYGAGKAFAEWTARAVGAMGAMVGSVLFKEALAVSIVSSNLHWRVFRTFFKRGPHDYSEAITKVAIQSFAYRSKRCSLARALKRLCKLELIFCKSRDSILPQLRSVFPYSTLIFHYFNLACATYHASHMHLAY
nr:hypothetical protein [Tanacetum cinerariifolium]